MPCPYVRETITRLPCLTLGMRSGTTCGERRVDGHSGEMRAPNRVRGRSPGGAAKMDARMRGNNGVECLLHAMYEPS